MSEYVPVTELMEENDKYPLQWSFSLPPSIDAERIVVNMDRLSHQHRIGAIAASVVFDYQGERTEYTPGISGINADGSALAAKTGVIKKAKDTNSDMIDLFPQFVPRDFGKVLALHRINKAAMVDRISDGIRNGETTREKLWAHELDNVFRQSFRKITAQHLMRRNTLMDSFVGGMWSFQGPYNVFAYSQHLIPPELVAFSIGTYSLVVGASMLRIKSRSNVNPIKERHWSFSPTGYQLDRYCIASTLSRMPGLVKVQK